MGEQVGGGVVGRGLALTLPVVPVPVLVPVLNPDAKHRQLVPASRKSVSQSQTASSFSLLCL